MTTANRALVVDDMPVNRLLAVKLLSKGGWTVLEAADGPTALERLEEAGPLELVLLDISMPDMSGQEVCQLIRERRLGGDAVKVIAYTAHAMPEETEDFLNIGFDAVLIKPISRGVLSGALSEVGLSLTVDTMTGNAD